MSYMYADDHHQPQFDHNCRSRCYAGVERSAQYRRDFQPYDDPPQSRQPSCWDPPPHRASQGCSDYDQPYRPYTRRAHAARRQRDSASLELFNVAESQLIDSFTQGVDRIMARFDKLENRWDAMNHRIYNLYAPPRPEPAPPFGRTRYHPPRYPTFAGGNSSNYSQQPTYQPPHSPTCLDPLGFRTPQRYTAHDQPLPPGCPPPHAADSRRLSNPHLRHEPSSSSLDVAAVAVPPPPAQRAPSCSPTNSCWSAASRPAEAAIPSWNLPPPAPPCSPDISGEVGDLLDDDSPPPAVISQPGSHDTRPTLVPYVVVAVVSNSMKMEISEGVKRVCSSSSFGKRIATEEIHEFDEEKVNKNFPKLFQKEIKAAFFRSSLETKEKDLSVLPKKPRKDEKREIQSLVEEHKAALEIQINDLEVERKEKRMLSEKEIRLKTEELVSHTVSHTMEKLKKRGQTFAFDPGGTLSCVVISTLRTRWISTVGELIRFSTN